MQPTVWVQKPQLWFWKLVSALWVCTETMTQFSIWRAPRISTLDVECKPNFWLLGKSESLLDSPQTGWWIFTGREYSLGLSASFFTGQEVKCWPAHTFNSIFCKLSPSFASCHFPSGSFPCSVKPPPRFVFISGMWGQQKALAFKCLPFSSPLSWAILKKISQRSQWKS